MLLQCLETPCIVPLALAPLKLSQSRTPTCAPQQGCLGGALTPLELSQTIVLGLTGPQWVLHTYHIYLFICPSLARSLACSLPPLPPPLPDVYLALLCHLFLAMSVPFLSVCLPCEPTSETCD